MFCHYCGEEIQDGAAFCPHCGKETAQEAPAAHPQTPPEPRQTAASAPASADRNKKDKKKQKKGKGKRFLFLLAAVLLLGGALFLTALFLGYRTLGGLEIQISKTYLRYEEDLDCYYLADSFTGFEGTVTGTTALVDEIHYEIADANDTVVSSGTASFDGKTWKIGQPGFMMGINTLTVSASTKVKRPVTASLSIVNTRPEFQDYVSLSLSDTDSDDLIDYYESFYQTDPENPDTDGDGLSDSIEILITGTDPTRYSTENDGICDADRDSDGDGLSNAAELDLGTDPGCWDTDGDGLSDSEEISVYGTDPLHVDTDGDGASDGWEIAHQYDPLVFQESFQTVQSAAAKDSAVSASVSLVCNGNPEGVSIEPAAIPGLLDETMTGYLGSAYSFSYDGSFTSAVITMAFDPQILATGAEPAIYYFNKETQLLEELPTTIQGSTASAEVTHFSTYVLLDKTQISLVVEEDILTPEEIDNTIVNLAFVVDYSASMDTNDPEYIRLKIVEEYLSKLRDGKDSAALIQFAAYATSLVPLSSDMEMLVNATRGISNTSSDGCSNSEAGTNGSDGLRRALDELSTSTAATSQYIIFLTDGEDTTSSYDYEELIAEAVEKQIVIYAVGMGECDEEVLSHIAQATGGKFHYASAVDYETDGTLSLKDVFREIEQETVDYYADSNGDGISDYYTRLICEGRLTTGTGTNPFGTASYEEIQAEGNDFDHDGLVNGAEIAITETKDQIYLKYLSSPIDPDTDQDGYPDFTDNRRLLWDVGDRDLLVFSDLAFQDASSLVRAMYDAGQLREADRAMADHWVITDYVDEYVLMDYFSATTFHCQDNIVIAYRGTNEDWEWVDNFLCYGLLNHHTEETHARNYARKIAAAYPDHRIYITGHSLGGYLAQIGAAELLEHTAATPERVAYFNGIGINFTDYFGCLPFLVKMFPEMVEDNAQARPLYDAQFHVTDILTLTEYAKSGNLISYEIQGDLVSALGSHCGQRISWAPSESRLQYYQAQSEEKQDQEPLWSTLLNTQFKRVFSVLSARNIFQYCKTYNVYPFMDYMGLTHERDSFFEYIQRGGPSLPAQ